jgi:transketolase
MAARDALRQAGIETAVVSMPCWSLFDRQDEAYRRQVLGQAPRIAVEAASTFGWERYVGADGEIVGMTRFGASAPYEELYRKFGITADGVAAAVRRALDRNR